jgi:hypothetical protein
MPNWLRVRGEFRERAEGFENSGIRRHARRHVLPDALQVQRNRHEQVRGGHRAAAGCARRQEDRRPDRHAVQGAD